MNRGKILTNRSYLTDLKYFSQFFFNLVEEKYISAALRNEYLHLNQFIDSATKKYLLLKTLTIKNICLKFKEEPN